MTRPRGRPLKKPDDRESFQYAVRVKPAVFMSIESSSAGESTQVLRELLERFSLALDAGETPETIFHRLAPLDKYKSIGGDNATPTA